MENYEHLNVIGKGNFGSISKIKRISDGKILVWKEMDYGKMSEKEKSQIVAEVNILRELKHPHIVKYYDRIIDKKNTKIYIIMEYCEGGDIGHLIKRLKKNKENMAEDLIWKVFTQVVLAIYECHSMNKDGKKVLHRDLKPNNVFLDSENNVKLGDFGLARVLSNESIFAQSHVGTPYYMSPEQIEEKEYDEKSDIWSLGCLLYELTTLNPPFEAKNHYSLAIKIKSGKVERISNRYSEELQRVILWLMQVDPVRRPSIEDLLNLPQVSLRIREKRLKENFIKLKKFEESLKLKETEITEKERNLEERECILERTKKDLDEREKEINLKLISINNQSNYMSFSNYNQNNQYRNTTSCNLLQTESNEKNRLFKYSNGYTNSSHTESGYKAQTKEKDESPDKQSISVRKNISNKPLLNVLKDKFINPSQSSPIVDGFFKDFNKKLDEDRYNTENIYVSNCEIPFQKTITERSNDSKNQVQQSPAFNYRIAPKNDISIDNNYVQYINYNSSNMNNSTGLNNIASPNQTEPFQSDDAMKDLNKFNRFYLDKSGKSHNKSNISESIKTKSIDQNGSYDYEDDKFKDNNILINRKDTTEKITSKPHLYLNTNMSTNRTQSKVNPTNKTLANRKLIQKTTSNTSNTSITNTSISMRTIGNKSSSKTVKHIPSISEVNTKGTIKKSLTPTNKKTNSNIKESVKFPIQQYNSRLTTQNNKNLPTNTNRDRLYYQDERSISPKSNLYTNKSYNILSGNTAVISTPYDNQINNYNYFNIPVSQSTTINSIHLKDRKSMTKNYI